MIPSLRLSVLLLLAVGILSVADSATFTFTNNCGYTVWPGLLSNAGTSPLSTTGFSLDPSESRSVDPPEKWSGRLWARTHCSTDPTGRFSCGTGDCGSGTVECSGSGAAPPATLAEIALDGYGGKDYYDVSLVDGYNLPMLVVVEGGADGGACATTGCLVDLNGGCPADLKMSANGVDGTAACQSACRAFGTPEYCCTGEYDNSKICQPTMYSEYFKNACPRAYSYAFDDSTSTFTCAAGASYVITFCPSKASLKSSDVETVAGLLPLINDTSSLASYATPMVAKKSLLPMLAVVAILWCLCSDPKHVTELGQRLLFFG